jgi:hypothetical protein
MQSGLHRRSVLAKPPAWRLCVTPALRFRGDLRRHVGRISATLTAKFFNSGLYFDFAFGMEGPCRDVAAVTHGVQLRVQATFRSTYTPRNRTFFKRLAAVRCAFKCVASIIT